MQNKYSNTALTALKIAN